MNLETGELAVKDARATSQREANSAAESADSCDNSVISLQCALAFPCVKQHREGLCYIQEAGRIYQHMDQTVTNMCCQRGVVTFPERDPCS